MSIDNLKEYGLEEMDNESIRNFLSNRGMGVLGLPSKDAPYLIPMSFGYDGNKHLYFTYFLGDSSQKQKLTKESDKARFLVYSAESVFSWESVLLTGTITELPEEDWNAHQDVLENSWRLDVFREADTVGKLKLYLFEIEESSGVRYAELPPGYNPD